MTSVTEFWPGGAKLASTISMHFEAGGQPISGAGGPITEPILDGFPDLGQNGFYEYGAREGVPRLLVTWGPGPPARQAASERHCGHAAGSPGSKRPGSDITARRSHKAMYSS
jgi:hypothetical protein